MLKCWGHFCAHEASVVYCKSFTYHIFSIRHRGYFISLFVLVQPLIKGGYYFGIICFIGKQVDSNDSWIRYMQAIQLGLIDAGSSTPSLSVLLSAMETSLRTWTLCGYYSRGGNYSRVVSNWRNTVLAIMYFVTIACINGKGKLVKF